NRRRNSVPKPFDDHEQHSESIGASGPSARQYHFILKSSLNSASQRGYPQVYTASAMTKEQIIFTVAIAVLANLITWIFFQPALQFIGHKLSDWFAAYAKRYSDAAYPLFAFPA